MNTVIENYEALSELTAQMRVAAARGDWEGLAELEQQCSQRAEIMQVQGADTPISESTRLRKVALIRKILADDAEIRNHIDPRMAQLQRSIPGAGQAHHL